MKRITLSLLVSFTLAQNVQAQDSNGIALPVLQPYSDSTAPVEIIEVSVSELPITDNDAAIANNVDLAMMDLSDDLNGTPATAIVNLDAPLPEPTYIVPQTTSEIALLLSAHMNPVSWQGINNKLRSFEEVRQLYADANYQPLWTSNGRLTALGATLIKETKEAWTHALRPSIYHTESTANLTAGQKVNDPARLELILTDAFITYKKHLANGIVNPKRQFKTWNTRPEQLNFLKLYQQAAEKGSVSSILTVHNNDYRQLQKAYVKAKSAGNNQVQQQPIILAKSLKVGQKGEAVITLRSRLGLPTDSNVYDGTVRQAVKTYQEQNGLGADGIAGPRTLRHMNGGSSGRGDDADKIAINMERLRWHRPAPNGNYVWVNIPAYKMAVRNGNQYVFESNVIVGRGERKTPVFRDTLEYVVLAPYWNVPSTIFKEDKLPKLQKNPHALGKSMQVVSKASGQVVDPATVNWKDGGEGYRLRELPGPKNSLGRMKFLFPNNHAIYLHDTPTRSLFKKQDRAFSSGCVRVERAEDLSVFLLDDMGYNRERIKKDSRKTKEKWLKLAENKRYPVFLDYYTVWADKSGKVQYSSDIYGYDEPLKKMYTNALDNL